MKYVPKTPEKNHNVSTQNEYSELLKRFSIIATILIVVVMGTMSLLDNLVLFIPRSAENYLGNALNSKIPCAKNGHKDAAKISSIFERVKAVSNVSAETKLKLCFVDDDVQNAFAAIGGRIIFHKGLLEEISDEKEIAFILAHEIGHQENRHHVRGMAKVVVLGLLSSLFMGQNETGKVMETLLSSGAYYFSREHEKESDLFALAIIQKLYGSKKPAIDAMKKLENLSDNSKWMTFFSTHPLPSERIEYLELATD